MMYEGANLLCRKFEAFRWELTLESLIKENDNKQKI